MKYKQKEVTGYPETLKEMFRLAEEYQWDLLPFQELTPEQFFEMVKNLKFRKDPMQVEHVSRPAIILDPLWGGPRDCDDKATAVIAMVKMQRALNNKRWPHHVRAVVSGNSLNGLGFYFPHHVYTEVLINGWWEPYDVTFPENKIGQRLYTIADGSEPFREVFEEDGRRWSA